jgi:hypothetical protein
MAELFAGGHAASGPTAAMTDAIRAVCEWLRGTKANTLGDDGFLAQRIEREFLEPR